MNKAFKNCGKRPFKSTRYGLIYRRRLAIKKMQVAALLAVSICRISTLRSQGITAGTVIAKTYIDTFQSVNKILSGK